MSCLTSPRLLCALLISVFISGVSSGSSVLTIRKWDRVVIGCCGGRETETPGVTDFRLMLEV